MGVLFKTVEVNESSGGKSQMLLENGIELIQKKQVILKSQKGQSFVIDEVLETDTKIVCLYIFLFSKKYASTTGVTTIWADSK